MLIVTILHQTMGLSKDSDVLFQGNTLLMLGLLFQLSFKRVVTILGNLIIIILAICFLLIHDNSLLEFIKIFTSSGQVSFSLLCIPWLALLFVIRVIFKRKVTYSVIIFSALLYYSFLGGCYIVSRVYILSNPYVPISFAFTFLGLVNMSLPFLYEIELVNRLKKRLYENVPV